MAAPAENLLVYRDRLGVRSEVQFLRRLYAGFTRLAPVWVGCHVEPDAAQLGAPALHLGNDGAAGAVERALFKQLGVVPRRPDLAALRPLLIHAHFGRGGALALPLARKLKVPLAVTYHGGDATKETHYRRRCVPTIYQRRLPALLREAALIHCVSDHIRDVLLARGFPAAKLRVVRYGIDTDPPVAPPADETAPYLLFVGRFVEKKGIAYLLEAMRRRRAAGDNTALVMVGDGPLKDELRRQAATLDSVTWPGWETPAEVRSRMRGAVALIVPSITAKSGDEEGLPNVVIEAMAQGTPVIGSRHAGIGEAIADGENGLLVPPGDAAALADAIARLVGDPDQRTRLGAAARRTAVAHFDAKTQSRLLEDAFLSLAGVG
jgi:glycosyltransferase involved in cell wall biosynthesis